MLVFLGIFRFLQELIPIVKALLIKTKQWKSSCGEVVSVLASYTSDPGFDLRECLVGFGCFFTVLATLLGLCVCLSTQIVVRYIVLIYPGSCIVQSYETICPEAVVSKHKKTIYSLRIKITYIVN